MAIQKFEHAELRVTDLEQALEFHTEVLGLVELARDGNRAVYLGCGIDENYDVALTNGGTGVEHFAFDVTSEDDLDDYGRRLANMGIQTETRTDAEPGQARALRFKAPSGHTLELAVLDHQDGYLQVGAPKRPRGRGAAPVDIDHISVVASDVRALVDFLREGLGFVVSDVFQPAPDVWGAAWLRVGEHHHDLALLEARGADESLHHLAWSMESIDHIKRGLDYLAQRGLPVEVGPGRHSIGSNVFAYFQTPGGNRYEFSAEMARVTTRGAEPGVWSELFPQGFSAWGHAPPESFQRGS